MRAIVDTSVLIAQESGRGLADLPDELALSVITTAELELGVLRARDTETRSRRLTTLTRARALLPVLPIDAEVGSCFARIAAAEREAGRSIRRHDAWIAATALRHGAAVVTQDADFGAFPDIEVVRV